MVLWMTWLNKTAFYFYKGRRPCRIVDDIGRGKVLIEFRDGQQERASVYQSNLTTKPVVDNSIINQIVECPDCNLINPPHARKCQTCHHPL